MIKKTAVLAGLLCVMFVERSYGAFCSKSDIDACIQVRGGWFYNEILAYFTEQQFTEKCRDLAAYKDCFLSFKDHCGSSDILVFEGQKEAFDYACDNPEVYVRNNECYARGTVQSGDEECAVEHGRTLDSLQEELDRSQFQDDIDDINQQICDTFDSLNKCIKDVMTEHCGSEIAEWQYTFDTKYYAPRKELQGCGSAGNFCTQTANDQCLEPFTSKWHMGDLHNHIFFKYYTDEEFAEMCRDYGVYEVCIEPFKDNCNSISKATFEGEKAFLAYACGEGADMYTRNKACFALDSVQTDGGLCDDQIDMADTPQEFCDAFKSSEECTTEVLTTHCDREIVEWHVTLHDKLYGEHLELFGCGGEWSAFSSWSECSVTCGDGTESRTRSCPTSDCLGDTIEYTSSTAGSCYGEWSAFGSWSECSVTCGDGTERRTRSCPTSDCLGGAIEYRSCSAGSCGSDDAGLSLWVIVGIIGGGLVVVALAILGVCLCVKKRPKVNLNVVFQPGMQNQVGGVALPVDGQPNQKWPYASNAPANSYVANPPNVAPSTETYPLPMAPSTATYPPHVAPATATYQLNGVPSTPSYPSPMAPSTATYPPHVAPSTVGTEPQSYMTEQEENDDDYEEPIGSSDYEILRPDEAHNPPGNRSVGYDNQSYVS